MIVRKWNVIPATIKVTIVFVELSLYSKHYFLWYLYIKQIKFLSASQGGMTIIWSQINALLQRMSNTIVVQTGKARFAGFLPDTTQAAEFAPQRSKLFIPFLTLSLSNLSYYFCFAWHFFASLTNVTKFFFYLFKKKQVFYFTDYQYFPSQYIHLPQSFLEVR